MFADTSAKRVKATMAYFLKSFSVFNAWDLISALFNDVSQTGFRFGNGIEIEIVLQNIITVFALLIAKPVHCQLTFLTKGKFNLEFAKYFKSVNLHMFECEIQNKYLASIFIVV